MLEKDRENVRVLLSLVEPDERGDPESPLRWTTKSLRRLAGELARLGCRLGPDTVAGLSHDSPEKDAAKAVPYGICEIGANAGGRGPRWGHRRSRDAAPLVADL